MVLWMPSREISSSSVRASSSRTWGHAASSWAIEAERMQTFTDLGLSAWWLRASKGQTQPRGTCLGSAQVKGQGQRRTARSRGPGKSNSLPAAPWPSPHGSGRGQS